LRKGLTALAAVPVVATLYLPLLIRRNVAARVALVFGAGAIVAAGAFAIVSPRQTVATPQTEPEPVPAAAFRPIVVSHGLVNPIIVDFREAMDRVSVQSAMTIAPNVPVAYTWSSDSTSLAVTPLDAWLPSTFYTLTIDGSASNSLGAPIGAIQRSTFLTRAGATGVLQATTLAGERAQVGTRLWVAFDAPVDVETVIGAFRSEPVVAGTWSQPAPYLGTQLLFTPSEPLAPGTTYTFSFDESLRDVDGAPLGMRPLLTVKTDVAPAVVRFRPRNSWTDVPREQVISVRFTKPMDRKATRAAFSVTIDGKPIAGVYRWAEKDTVLVFDPRDRLPYGKKVAMQVGTGARSAAGSPVEKPVTGVFTVEKKPVVRTAARTTTPISRSSGGSSTGSATWLAVERYYHKLLNCTRGGGLVTSSGSCSSPGGSGLAALKLDAGISSKVARPYARKIARAGVCDHFYGGTTPGSRLKAAGYTNYTWGENIGCRSGNPYSAVLGSHIYFQNERSYNGGHWKNMMNPRYDRVGIGVWVYSGRVRLVVDFYHP
jgi:hypothetical protein